MLTRRGLLGGFGALLAAPAIVRVTSMMPVKVITPYADGVVIPELVTLYRQEFVSAFEEQYALLRKIKEDVYRITGIDSVWELCGADSAAER